MTADTSSGEARRLDPEPADPRVVEAIEFMRANADRPLTIAAVASRIHTSAPHLFRLFRRTAGSAPWHVFKSIRMELAAELLETTDLSPKEIAARVGYSSGLGSFGRAFRAFHGISPAHHRRLAARMVGMAK